MNITKDEAAILAYALKEAKYSMNDRVIHYANSIGIQSIDAFQILEDKLEAYSDDKRRHGRKSKNDLNDCIRRFIINNPTQ